MSNVKKTYNSKPAGAIKSIFTGIGAVIGAIALILGVVLLSPILIVVAGSIAQIGGWILLIGIVILLPAWAIGKAVKWLRGEQPETKAKNGTVIDLTEESDEPDKDKAYREAMEKAHKEEIDALHKEVERAKQEVKALKLDKREKFNKKVTALKNSAGDFKNAMSELFK